MKKTFLILLLLVFFSLSANFQYKLLVDCKLSPFPPSEYCTGHPAKLYLACDNCGVKNSSHARISANVMFTTRSSDSPACETPFAWSIHLGTGFRQDRQYDAYSTPALKITKSKERYKNAEEDRRH